MLRTATVVWNHSPRMAAVSVLTKAREGNASYVCDEQNVAANASAVCLGGLVQRRAFVQFTAQGNLAQAGARNWIADYTLPTIGSATGEDTTPSEPAAHEDHSTAPIPNETATDTRTAQTDTSTSLPTEVHPSTSNQSEDTQGFSSEPALTSESESESESDNEPSDSSTAPESAQVDEQVASLDTTDAEPEAALTPAAGTWRPHPEIGAGWHCGATANFSLWSAQNCLIVQSGYFQSAIVVRNRTQSLASISALTQTQQSTQSFLCASSGVAANDYSVCFGSTAVLPRDAHRLTASGELREPTRKLSVEAVSLDFD
jgi:hypothetical protein